MEFNCIVFPAKERTDIQHIQDQVVLVPSTESGRHVYYSTYVNPRWKVVDSLSIIAEGYSKSNIPQRYSLTRQTQESQHNPSLQPYKHSPSNTHQSQQQFKYNRSRTYTSADTEYQLSPISHDKGFRKVQGFIPCLFMPGNQKLIIYFHGNAEDITSTSGFANFINLKMGYSVIVMEYPGYSVYDGTCSAEKIEYDCLGLIRYLMKIGFSLSNMFVIGRSIGTGPALFLCQSYKVSGLMLISPFLSITTLIRDKYGTLASMLVKQRFENYKVIQDVSIPILILHGLQDSMVPFAHSSRLQQLAGGKCYVKLAEKMTHGSFNFTTDFLNPLKSFLSEINF